ncbi:hypothetical protein GF068_32265 [Polyangium spumosum]|uniref:Uncharacterized protein n=1 Tax=Polyangium spumosum TaxID=889282 RepID=A0A6N7Q1T4_9BACT|nr:hypothetical protein [Polyangium spumosum]
MPQSCTPHVGCTKWFPEGTLGCCTNQRQKRLYVRSCTETRYDCTLRYWAEDYESCDGASCVAPVHEEPAPIEDLPVAGEDPLELTCGPRSLGGPTSCKSEDLWVSHAEAHCKSLGLNYSGRTSTMFWDSCASGMWRRVMFGCC